MAGPIDISSKLNQTMVTAIPIADAVPTMKPGAYVITAAGNRRPQPWGPLATQWFIVSDLGLTALSGHDGVHAIVRSLSTAEPVAGVKLQLIVVNNDILGQWSPTMPATPILIRPGARHRRHGAAIGRCPDRQRLRLPRPDARRLRPHRPWRRRTGGAAGARRLPHARARHLPAGRDRSPHRAGARCARQCRPRPADDAGGRAAGRRRIFARDALRWRPRRLFRRRRA